MSGGLADPADGGGGTARVAGSAHTFSIRRGGNMNIHEHLQMLYRFSETGMLARGNRGTPDQHMLAEILVRLERIELALAKQSTSTGEPI